MRIEGFLLKEDVIDKIIDYQKFKNIISMTPIVNDYILNGMLYILKEEFQLETKKDMDSYFEIKRLLKLPDISINKFINEIVYMGDYKGIFLTKFQLEDFCLENICEIKESKNILNFDLTLFSLLKELKIIKEEIVYSEINKTIISIFIDTKSEENI